MGFANQENMGVRPVVIITSEDNPVSTARNKVTEASGRVVRMAIQLQQIGDDLYGEWMANDKAGPIAPPRCGEFGNLHDKIDALHTDLGALEDQIARFSNLQPIEAKPATGNGKGSLR